MADGKSPEINELILGYEDLNDDERRLADEALAERPDLRARLELLQQRERGAVDPVPGDLDLLMAPINLSAGDEAKQRESLGKVRRSAGLPRSGKSWVRTRFLLPLAAVLALVVLFPRLSSHAPVLGQVSVMEVVLDDDGHRSGTLNQGSDIFRSGQAISLEFDLARDARVFVFHVDPRGRVEVVHAPAETGRAVSEIGRLIIPDPESDDLWFLGRETGWETFIVAAVGDAGIPGDMVIDQASRFVSGAFSHDEAVAGLRSSLADAGCQVEKASFQHID